MQESQEPVVLASFHDLLVDFCDRPAIKIMVSERAVDMDRWFNLRLQFAYRLTHRLAELVQLSSIHSPFERFTDFSTRQPKINVILFVGHRILTPCEPGESHHGRGRSSLGSS